MKDQKNKKPNHFDSDVDKKSPNLKHQIEKELLSQAKSGDLQAFGKIFNFYNKRVYTVAFGIVGNNQLAEDITQQVFIRLFRSFSKYDTGRKFFTYLYRITVNVCFDVLKQEKTKQIEFIELTDKNINNIEINTNPLQQVEQTEFHFIVKKLLQQLGVNQRTAFMLRDIEGLDVNEVAKILKCKKATVRAHIHLARKFLRKMIAEKYPEYIKR